MTEPALRIPPTEGLANDAVCDTASDAGVVAAEPVVEAAPVRGRDVVARRSRAARKADEKAGRGAVRFSIIVSAVRCTITYLLLPAWAPLSAAGAASFMKPVEFVLHIVAIVSVSYGVRRFWRSGHKFKWYYLALAVTVTFISLIAIAQMFLD